MIKGNAQAERAKKNSATFCGESELATKARRKGRAHLILGVNIYILRVGAHVGNYWSRVVPSPRKRVRIHICDCLSVRLYSFGLVAPRETHTHLTARTDSERGEKNRIRCWLFLVMS